MFTNFFKVTLRSLLKSKLFVFINIIGLGLALACCIVAYLNYTFAITFDRQHENFDELYQISINRDNQGSNQRFAIAPMALAPTLKQDIPGIKAYSRFETSGITIKRDDNIFNRRIAFVDDDFMDMFTFPVLHGSKDGFKELSQVMISERTAFSLFGRADVVGETVEIVVSGKPNLLLTVGGVFEDTSQKSTLQFQLLSHFENFHRYFEVEKGDWGRFVDGIFIQSADPSVREKAPALIQKHTAAQNDVRKDFIVSGFWLQSMDEVAFNQRDLNGTSLGNEALHPAHILAPNVMALLILLLACFNFTNTAVAMSNRRLKEIGIRKTVGGGRGQLVFQFLGENVILCLLALGAGILFATWLVPKYSDMWPNMDVMMSLTDNPQLVVFLVGVLLFTALIAGGYPAFFVSKFKPVEILRGTLRIGSSSILSKILLGFQFLISVLALISGFAFLQNSEYQNSLDQGYDKEGMIIIPMNDPSEATTFRAAIESNPMFKSVSQSRNHIGWGLPSGNLKSADTENEVSVMDVGMDYLETAGLSVIAGRGFNLQNKETDRQGGVIINERTAAQFGWKDPIGQQLTLYDTIRYNVVGMVKDFYVYGLWGAIDPVMIRLRDDDEINIVAVNVDPAQIDEARDYLQEKWAEVIPNRPHNVQVHNQNVLGEAREINGNILVIFMFLAVIAVVLSAIGLFTLVSINIISRTKEIGIRKVLGATIARIGLLINRPFLIIVCISAVLGAFAAWQLTGILMGSIWTYYTSLNFLSFAVPIFSLLLISFLSISGKVVKAARRNPVESLRYE